MVMRSTGRRARVRHSTGISQELLARMMRRRAMSYARLDYLPGTTGRMTPLEHWHDKKEHPVLAYEKVEPPAGPGQKKEPSPGPERARDPMATVIKEES